MINNTNTHLDATQSDLGKKTTYETHYNPDKLFSIARKTNRDAIGIKNPLPFHGVDIWNHYEVSWLNKKGKPIVGLASIIYDCTSPNIVESKSLKLYFNSLNNTTFESTTTLEETIQKDLIEKLNTNLVQVSVMPLSTYPEEKILSQWSGICLDDMDIECSVYHTNPDFLKISSSLVVEEIVYSDLLKSQCLVTNQPDFCSVQIAYKGNLIDHSGLLRYIVSFRETNEFHEQCIEKIFMHILERCKPERLSVYGRSTRRGGLDINAYRTTDKNDLLPVNTRLSRQ